MGKRNFVGIAAVLAGIIAGCTPASDSSPPTGGPATGGQTRVEAPTAPKMAALDPEQVRKGQVVFAENCVACHQEGGKGKPGVAPSLTDKEFLTFASDRFLYDTIRDGRTDTQMPPWGESLKEDQINAVIAYLRSHAQQPSRAGEVEGDRTAMGDPRLGKRWFTQICAGCHGPNGEGYAGEGSGTAIGKPGFLNKASDGFIRAIVKNGRSNTPMHGFQGPAAVASLTDQEIDDIISYLRVIE
ncbi:MAG: c-type cytochrome [Alphaproteobacteria bacterium]|nr:c-type cytochrome [Alphaproteobacteria bacterium]